MATGFVYLLRPFLSYAFVCVYLEQRTRHKRRQYKKKKKKTRDKRHKTRMKHVHLGLIHRSWAVGFRLTPRGMLVGSGWSVTPCCGREDCPGRWQWKQKVEAQLTVSKISPLVAVCIFPWQQIIKACKRNQKKLHITETQCCYHNKLWWSVKNLVINLTLK